MATHFDNEKIIPIELQDEMKSAYIDYAMSVIVGRALPDVRDGLKPVHRRILYAMYEDNLTSDRPYRKAATTVGNVLGRYHPHGDASVYDAMVRLAQNFSLRHPLVDGHGNFGSIDGHPAAAYRYTEARMSRLASHLLTDIDKETVDFSPNFDNNRKEPTVLPARFPNLLVNGSSGIAVGMATNIPPHNLAEVVDATCFLIDNRDADVSDLFTFIQGPDFPTGGIIMGMSGIRAAYYTGRGRIKVRAKAEIEEHSNGRYRIVVKEMPYMVNKARLVESIADLHKDKKVDGIADLRDESSGRTGISVVIDLKRDANPQVVLNQLYRYTQMEITVSIILLALADGQPKVMSLHEILSRYIDFQQDIVVRRTRFDLKKAEDRAHLLEGLRIASDNIDEVIQIIRTSYNNAKERLMERFNLSDIQSQAILEMQLRRLQGLEREKIETEHEALRLKITDYKEILASPTRQFEIIKEELNEVKNKFADSRRTQISPVDDEIDIEDLIPEEECAYTLTRFGYIKRVPASTYRAQKRGGKGVIGMSTRDEDYVKTLFTASTHDHILFFSNFGRVHRMKGYMVPEAGRTARGVNIVNLLQLEGEERITAMLPLKDYENDKYIVLATKHGVIKRMRTKDLFTTRKAGIRVLTIGEGDDLIGVRMTNGSANIVLASRMGRAIRFHENDVRPMGRMASGVRGIRLKDDDYVIGIAKEQAGAYLLTVTENGYGKLTRVSEYTVHRRGGQGVIAHNLTEKTGLLCDIKIVHRQEDLLLITDEGVIIRTAASDVRVCGRASQGVILMRLEPGVRVIAVEKLAPEDETEDADNLCGTDFDEDCGQPEGEDCGQAECESEGHSVAIEQEQETVINDLEPTEDGAEDEPEPDSF